MAVEAGEMADPFGIAQTLQPHARRRRVVAEAQDRLREIGRADRVVKIGAERQDRGFRAIRAGCGGVHQLIWEVGFEGALHGRIGPMAIGCRAMA